jgi:hypothetical protein
MEERVKERMKQETTRDGSRLKEGQRSRNRRGKKFSSKISAAWLFPPTGT